VTAPLVTVLTATYNQERFIGRCIESVLAQSRPDWEMLLFDDGSTDATREVARGYKDPRIYLLEHPHTGIWALGERYNQALARARGRVAAILDGDDWWPADKLSRQTPAFDDPGTVLSHGSCALYDEEGRPLVRRLLPFSLRGRIPGSRFLRTLIRRRHIPWSSTVMVRIDALRAVGGFIQTAGEPLVDYPTWLHVAPMGDVAGLGAVVGCYRIHSSSVARRMADQVAEGHWRCVKEYLDRRGDALLPAERAALLRWSRAAYDQDMARIRMKRGEIPSARGLFRRAFQGGPPFLKLRAALRLLQTVFLGSPRGPL
jgi:glycosyltransferase involved in cell wall biosynthesis